MSVVFRNTQLSLKPDLRQWPWSNSHSDVTGSWQQGLVIMSKIVGALGFALCSDLGSECVLMTNCRFRAIRLYVLLVYLSLLTETLHTFLLLLSVADQAFPHTSGLLTLSSSPSPPRPWTGLHAGWVMAMAFVFPSPFSSSGKLLRFTACLLWVIFF